MGKLIRGAGEKLIKIISQQHHVCECRALRQEIFIQIQLPACKNRLISRRLLAVNVIWENFILNRGEGEQHVV